MRGTMSSRCTSRHREALSTLPIGTPPLPLSSVSPLTPPSPPLHPASAVMITQSPPPSIFSLRLVYSVCPPTLFHCFSFFSSPSTTTHPPSALSLHVICAPHTAVSLCLRASPPSLSLSLALSRVQPPPQSIVARLSPFFPRAPLRSSFSPLSLSLSLVRVHRPRSPSLSRSGPLHSESGGNRSPRLRASLCSRLALL